MSLSERAVAAPGRAVPLRPAPLAAVFILLMLAAALPVALVKTPVMIDVFNHLGRIHVIANRDRDPLLAQFYSIEWRIIPNLAMDALVPPLARLVGTYAAGKIFVLATLLLLASGPFAINAALYRRLSAGPLVGFLFLYNWIFFYGFVNYLFGVGLALWAVAAWIHWRDAPAVRRGGLSLLFALALFACHLYALGLYGLVLLSYEGWRGRALRRAHGRAVRRARLADLAAFAGPFLLVLPLMAASPTSGYAQATWWRLPEKLDGLYFIVKSYSAPVDLGFAVAILAALAWATVTGRLRLHPAGWVMLGAATLVYLAMPTMLFGSGIADMRLPVAVVFVLIGMARCELRPPLSPAPFYAAVAGLAALRFAFVVYAWHGYDAIVGAFERSFAQIAPGSRVLVAANSGTARSYTFRATLEHMPCLVMIERSSMASLAFTHPGKQILRLDPADREVSLFEGPPPDIAQLAFNPPSSGPWADWRRRFDYVYVLYTEAASLPPSAGLELLYRGDAFQLYRIPR